jgi:hypothetical protein
MHNLMSLRLGALFSEAPHEALADKLRLFGQFVGDWEFDFAGFTSDGSHQIGVGEWHFRWVLGGRAVQDVWIIPKRSERSKPNAPKGEYGTTLRFYDPNIDAWRVAWVGPVNQNVLTFIAKQTEDEIVMEGADKDGSPLRWIFSDIRTNSFFWRGVVSTDGGRRWRLQQSMSVRRVVAASHVV